MENWKPPIDHQEVLDLRGQGLTIRQIAKRLRCGTTTVFYHLSDGYRERPIRRRRDRASSVAAPVEAAAVAEAWPEFEGPAWVVDRKVWSSGPSKRFGYKCAGKGGKQQPERKQVAPLGVLAATDSYLRGDAAALRDYLRRVGRESLAVSNTGDDE